MVVTTCKGTQMKLFISWSGRASRDLAETFRGWIGMVLQQVVPFVSNADIDKGARWAQEIDAQLQDAAFGILILTPANRNAPWLLYEAGALSKQVSSSRVSCLLLDLKHTDVEFPLALFQNTEFNYDDMHKLVGSINKGCEHPIEEEKLRHIFDKFWPDLESAVERIRRQSEDSQLDQAAVRPLDSKIDELLELVRSLRAPYSAAGQFQALKEELASINARKLLLDALVRGNADNVEWPTKLPLSKKGVKEIA
jgi:hypothetical protein